MFIKVEWNVEGSLTVEVSDDDAALMLDKNNAASAPCDLEDLPQQAQDLIREKIVESIFDDPIEINLIEPVKKNTLKVVAPE